MELLKQYAKEFVLSFLCVFTPLFLIAIITGEITFSMDWFRLSETTKLKDLMSWGFYLLSLMAIKNFLGIKLDKLWIFSLCTIPMSFVIIKMTSGNL